MQRGYYQATEADRKALEFAQRELAALKEEMERSGDAIDPEMLNEARLLWDALDRHVHQHFCTSIDSCYQIPSLIRDLLAKGKVESE